MKTFTISELKDSFRKLSQSSVEGVHGVRVIRSEKPGPVVGITIQTHGNEPAGLAVYRYLRHIYRLERNLLQGTVYFIINNLKAAERYFKAETDDEKKNLRSIDINMNRLPKDLMETGENGYELNRARELKKIWDKLDYGLDIHSTSLESPPMIIKLSRSGIEFVSSLPIEKVVSDIDLWQIGVPATYFYGGRKAEVYGIEAGSHTNGESFIRAIESARAFLSMIHLIPDYRPTVPKHVEYQIFKSIVFPDKSYELVEEFQSFQGIKKGQPIATKDGKPSIFAPSDCCALSLPKERFLIASRKRLCSSPGYRRSCRTKKEGVSP